MTEINLLVRLTKIERQVRVWQGLTFLAILVGSSAIAVRLNAAPSQWLKVFRVDANTIVAQEFDLVNPSGRVTARLVPDPKNADSPNLVLKYANDKPAILLRVDHDGSSLSMLDNNGQPRATMSEHANGPSLTLFDEDDRLRIDVDALNPSPQISIYDKARKRTIVAFSN